jgi:hypothetical protein
MLKRVEGQKLHTYTCPFWENDPEKPSQESGYCHLLNLGDWMENVDLLWDRVKLCGINEDLGDENDVL